MDAAVSKVLIVRSGTEHYALDMMTVQEVVYSPDITVLPHSSGFITGMFSWRQKQVAVADLGLFLGRPQPACSGDIVITVTSGNETGVLVEEIGPIVDIPLDSLISVDKTLAWEQDKVLQAFEHHGELVFMLETKALMNNLTQ